MKLREVLRPEHIVLPLAAGTVKQATEQLAERLVSTGAVVDAGRLNAVLRMTWPEDMVTVGDHAFLPHFRTEAVRGLVVALGISATPIRWEKDAHRQARIVILIVAPPRETPTYLQVVGALARALSDPACVLGLLAAKTPEQVLAAPALDAIELATHLTVRDVMTERVFSIKPDETLGGAARLMVEKDIRALPVVDDSGALLGMITHKELLRHLVPQYLQRTKTGEIRRGGQDARDMPVREAMARTVLCLSEEQTLSEVANLISSKDVDRFPVVREGAVVGFLTRADLVRRLIAI